jgi:hypothetical protein
MKIKEITLGAPAAERDIKRDHARTVDFNRGLMEYFVESDTYRSVQRGTTRILIGNRGSGKSAIFQVLAARERRLGTIVIEIAPDVYSYGSLGILLKKEAAGNWGKQGAYVVAWKHVLYVAAMKEISERITNVRTKALRRIKAYLRDNYAGSQDGLINYLISFAKRIEQIKVGSLTVSLDIRELDNLYKLEGLEPLLPDLAEVCASKKVIILVDELDTGWDGSEDARQFVAGLFGAALSVNKLTPDLMVMISLRRELYDNIPEIYEDAQKVRDMLRYVEWDEAGLKTLIDRRIRAALALLGLPAGDDVWTRLFADSMPSNGGSTFQYMVDRTLYRPRELIQFCNECIEKAPNDVTIINGATIRSAEATYSRDRAQDIAAEYQSEYPGLDAVFETFRGASEQFSREELEFHCLEVIEGERRCVKAEHWLREKTPSELIRILWRVGFLRAYHVATHRYLGPHQLATLNVEALNTFQIHEMFRIHYGIGGSKNQFS